MKCTGARPVLFFSLLFCANVFAQSPQCPAEERLHFDQWLTRPSSAIPPEKQTPVASSAQLDRVCMPNGQRAYLVARGVLPPRLVGGGPEQNDSIRDAMNGKKAIIMRVDRNGVPTAAYFLDDSNILGPESVRLFAAWQFAPATFKGKAVPVAFKLRLEIRYGDD